MLYDMARDFSRLSLEEIANAAEHRAKLLKELEPKHFRRSNAQNNAIETFEELARCCRRVIEMQDGYV